MPGATPAPPQYVLIGRFCQLKAGRALWFLKTKHDDSNIAGSGVGRFEGRTLGSVVSRHMGVMRSSKWKRTELQQS
jgi:hypothetical protein